MTKIETRPGQKVEKPQKSGEPDGDTAQVRVLRGQDGQRARQADTEEEGMSIAQLIERGRIFAGVQEPPITIKSVNDERMGSLLEVQPDGISCVVAWYAEGDTVEEVVQSSEIAKRGRMVLDGVAEGPEGRVIDYEA